MRHATTTSAANGIDIDSQWDISSAVDGGVLLSKTVSLTTVNRVVNPFEDNYQEKSQLSSQLQDSQQ